MDKKILTWTSLCQMAKSISKTRPDDFLALTKTGTDRFLPGHFVKLEHDMNFTIYRNATTDAGPILASVFGVATDQGYFTKMKVPLTPTSYRKRFWDRYMPVSFPSGLPKRGHNSLPAVFHSVDGKTSTGQVTLRQYRSEPARLTVDPGSLGYIVINDSTGKMVHLGDPLLFQNNDAAVETFEFDRGRRATWKNFPKFRSARMSEMMQPLPPGSCETRDEWLKSIYLAAERGIISKERCLPLAVRMWNAAYQFCSANPGKQAWFAAYPMTQVPGHRASPYLAYSRPTCVLEWRDCEHFTVEGEREAIPLGIGDLCYWTLPQIVVRFQGSGEDDFPELHHPVIGRECMMQPRHITMTLPPHGSPLMEEKPHYASVDARTQPCKSRLNGEHVILDGKTMVVRNDASLMVRYVERAYHGLTIVDAERFADSHHRYLGWHRHYNANRTWAQHDESGDAYCLKWRDYPDAVHVTSDFDEQPRGPDGPWSSITSGDIGFPGSPESAVGMVEEQILLDSMPLS